MSINTRRLAGGKVVYDVRLRAPDGTNYKRTFPTKREALLFEAEEQSAKARGGGSIRGQGSWRSRSMRFGGCGIG